MPQQQLNIQIKAPGFSGLNTQESPVGMGLEYASIADNCVIDEYGRIGTRQGFRQYSNDLDVSSIGVNPAVRTFEFVDIIGVSWLFVCSNGVIWVQNQESPYNLTPLPYIDSTVVSVTQNKWQMVGIGDRCYFVQEGLPILEFHAETQGTYPNYAGVTEMQTTHHNGQYPTGDFPNCATTAFGHLFVADFATDKGTIYYTGLNVGSELHWEGSINLTAVWPSGTDQIVAIKAHNNFLIIWGKRSIVVYSLEDPSVANASLVDTVEGIGCIARDSVCVIGRDVLFLDSTGVRSLGRTIQEKSMPIGDISYNVKKDIQKLLVAEDKKNIVAVFSPEDSLYFLMFPGQNTTYLFDTKSYLENGSFKTTRLPAKTMYCGIRTTNGSLFFGGIGGLYEYKGSYDSTSILGNSLVKPSLAIDATLGLQEVAFPISFKYWTQPQTFDAPSRIKFPKQIDITAIGGEALTLFLKWSFDYSSEVNQLSYTVEGGNPSFYGTSEFELAEFTANDNPDLWSPNLNLWGSGRVIKFGFETSVTGSPFSIQELNIQALLGRMI